MAELKALFGMKIDHSKMPVIDTMSFKALVWAPRSLMGCE